VEEKSINKTNKNQMHQIFAHYIDNFEKMNDPEHAEYYKWQVCYKFRTLMDEALCYFTKTLKATGIVKYKAYGECDVLCVDSNYLKLRVKKTGEEKQLGTAVVIANGIVSVDVPGFIERKTEYADVSKKVDSIPRTLEYAARVLEPYEEYLD